MTHVNTTAIKSAYDRFLSSYNYTLDHCYERYSRAKERAWQYCEDLMRTHNGCGLKVIGYNTCTFSAGFYFDIDGRDAFCYITRDYDRYIFLDEIYQNT